MRVTSITKSMNIKFATLPYSNADINVSMTAELAPGDDVAEAGQDLNNILLLEIKEFKEFKAAVDEVCVQTFDKPKSL